MGGGKSTRIGRGRGRGTKHGNDAVPAATLPPQLASDAAVADAGCVPGVQLSSSSWGSGLSAQHAQHSPAQQGGSRLSPEATGSDGDSDGSSDSGDSEKDPEGGSEGDGEEERPIPRLLSSAVEAGSSGRCSPAIENPAGLPAKSQGTDDSAGGLQQAHDSTLMRIMKGIMKGMRLLSIHLCHEINTLSITGHPPSWAFNFFFVPPASCQSYLSSWPAARFAHLAPAQHQNRATESLSQVFSLPHKLSGSRHLPSCRFFSFSPPSLKLFFHPVLRAAGTFNEEALNPPALPQLNISDKQVQLLDAFAALELAGKVLDALGKWHLQVRRGLHGCEWGARS